MCALCTAGVPNATDCLECVAGSETVREIAAIVCEECIAGRFSPVNGTVSCSNCDVGRYAPHNAIMCVDCQPGFISEELCDVIPRPHSLGPSDYHSRL